MCLRIGNKINTSANNAGKCLSITMLIFEILGLIAFIISMIIMFFNMGDKNDDYHKDYENGYSGRRGKYSRAEWAAVVMPLTAGVIALGLNILFTDFLIKSIYAKINTPYSEYLETQKNSEVSSANDYSKSINICNGPIENGQNALTFIGYDKDGHPIYSGSNKYYTKNNGNVEKNKK